VAATDVATEELDYPEFEPRTQRHLKLGRPHRKPPCQVISWPWRAALPTVPIPLLQGDAELAVNLQSVFQTVYEQSFCDRRLSYQEALVPPLPAADAAWAAERIRERSMVH
jgi:hypothetical protein